VQAGLPNPAWGNISSDRLGYDGAGRMIAKRYLAGGINGTTHAYNTPTSVAGFTTYYDYAGNKLYERQLQVENRSALYEPFTSFVPQGGYDSVNRLLQYQRGTLDSTGGLSNKGGGDITTPITLAGTNKSQTYDLDGLGNWKNTVYLPVGGSSTTELRRHNYLNELTKFGSTPVTYDHGNNAASSDPLIQQRGNGNIANDGTRIYVQTNRGAPRLRRAPSGRCGYAKIPSRVQSGFSECGSRGVRPILGWKISRSQALLGNGYLRSSASRTAGNEMRSGASQTCVPKQSLGTRKCTRSRTTKFHPSKRCTPPPPRNRTTAPPANTPPAS